MLSPLLFNLYISDLPDTYYKKFIYADDITLACQNKNFADPENQLSTDANIMSSFKKWGLTISHNPNKTEVSTFTCVITVNFVC